MMDKKDILARMSVLQFEDPDLLYSCYMSFLECGGLFVPADDVSSLGEDIFLAVEIAGYPRRFLPTRVAWISPVRISTHRPKGVGLAFSEHENCQRAKDPIEAKFGPHLRSDRIIFTL